METLVWIAFCAFFFGLPLGVVAYNLGYATGKQDAADDQ